MENKNPRLTQSGLKASFYYSLVPPEIPTPKLILLSSWHFLSISNRRKPTSPRSWCPQNKNCPDLGWIPHTPCKQARARRSQKTWSSVSAIEEGEVEEPKRGCHYGPNIPRQLQPQIPEGLCQAWHPGARKQGKCLIGNSSHNSRNHSQTVESGNIQMSHPLLMSNKGFH